MNESRVASRYAKSLLDLSVEQNVVEDVVKDMQLFYDICEQTPQLARVMKNPIVPHEKKSAILDSLLKGRVNKMSLAFFNIIVRKKRESYLYFIAKEFLKQYRFYKGIETAEVVTTYPLSEDQRTVFSNIVKEISGGKNVQLTEIVDETIIGGFVLRLEDRKIDQSVRAKLSRLRNNFKDNPYIAKI